MTDQESKSNTAIALLYFIAMLFLAFAIALYSIKAAVAFFLISLFIFFFMAFVGAISNGINNVEK